MPPIATSTLPSALPRRCTAEQAEQAKRTLSSLTAEIEEDRALLTRQADSELEAALLQAEALRGVLRCEEALRAAALSGLIATVQGALAEAVALADDGQAVTEAAQREAAARLQQLQVAKAAVEKALQEHTAGAIKVALEWAFGKVRLEDAPLKQRAVDALRELDVEAAAKQHAEEERQLAARRLEKAVAAREQPELDDAIAHAESFGVDTIEGRRVVAQLKAEAAVARVTAAAKEARARVEELDAALNIATTLGVDPQGRAMVDGRAQAEQMRGAAKRLRQAIAAEEVEELQAALLEAKQNNVDAALMAQAKAVLQRLMTAQAEDVLTRAVATHDFVARRRTVATHRQRVRGARASGRVRCRTEGGLLAHCKLVVRRLSSILAAQPTRVLSPNVRA